MDTLAITLRTRTPIWTGDIDGTTDRLHTTGIIGSLRWWYEAIVRGLGGWACDPSEHSCIYEPDNEICMACQVFGTTGWRRRFRLTIEADHGSSSAPQQSIAKKKPAGNRYKKKSTSLKLKPEWYFKPGWDGKITLAFTAFDQSFDLQIMPALLRLIENYGALAAKPQLGYGQIDLINPPEIDIPKLVESLRKLIAQWPGNDQRNAGKPSLSEMFFAEIEPGSGNTGDPRETMLALKYDLRKAFRDEPSTVDWKTLRHWVCGKERPEHNRKAAKVAISPLINNRLRVWGWIPGNLPVSSITRDDVMCIIHQIMRRRKPRRLRLGRRRREVPPSGMKRKGALPLGGIPP